jgi:hypothetical protein
MAVNEGHFNHVLETWANNNRQLPEMPKIVIDGAWAHLTDAKRWDTPIDSELMAELIRRR